MVYKTIYYIIFFFIPDLWYNVKSYIVRHNQESVIERMFFMLSVKKITYLLFVGVLLVFAAFPAMAAELSVKESNTKSGVVNITVPYISGAAGGKRVDTLVNQTIFTYINSQLKQVLDDLLIVLKALNKLLFCLLL